jgi:hypothetical protein
MGKLRSLLAFAVACALLAPLPAWSADLKLAHFMSPQHPMDRGIMTPLAEQVAAECEYSTA